MPVDTYMATSLKVPLSMVPTSRRINLPSGSRRISFILRVSLFSETTQSRRFQFYADQRVVDIKVVRHLYKNDFDGHSLTATVLVTLLLG